MNETYIIPEVTDDLPVFPLRTTPHSCGGREHRRREGGADDIIAVQAALCMLIAAGLIMTNIFRPDISGELFSRIKELTDSSHELFVNPIELLLSNIGK